MGDYVGREHPRAGARLPVGAPAPCPARRVRGPAASPTATTAGSGRRARDPRRRRDLGADAVGPARRALGSAEARARDHGAMRLTPPEPSFLDARNAILQSPPTRRQPARVERVRRARDGLLRVDHGSEDVSPRQDFAPAPLPNNGTIGGFVQDAETGDGDRRGDRHASAGRPTSRARPAPTATTRWTSRGARYTSVIFSAPGYDRVVKPVTVGARPVDLGAELRRNWASYERRRDVGRRRRPQGPGLRVAGGDRRAPRLDLVGRRGRRRPATMVVTLPDAGERARASASIPARAAWTSWTAAAQTRARSRLAGGRWAVDRGGDPDVRRRRPAPHEPRRRPRAERASSTSASRSSARRAASDYRDISEFGVYSVAPPV